MSLDVCVWYFVEMSCTQGTVDCPGERIPLRVVRHANVDMKTHSSTHWTCCSEHHASKKDTRNIQHNRMAGSTSTLALSSLIQLQHPVPQTHLPLCTHATACTLSPTLSLTCPSFPPPPSPCHHDPRVPSMQLHRRYQPPAPASLYLATLAAGAAPVTSLSLSADELVLAYVSQNTVAFYDVTRLVGAGPGGPQLSPNHTITLDGRVRQFAWRRDILAGAAT